MEILLWGFEKGNLYWLLLEFKLWYALGKLRAEKAAWRIAKERGLKLVTICSALVTAPDLCNMRNSTATIAYLKGTFFFFLMVSFSVHLLNTYHLNFNYMPSIYARVNVL